MNWRMERCLNQNGAAKHRQKEEGDEHEFARG
jgi:hypothetical protein